MKYFLTFITILTTDQFTKSYIEKNVPEGEKIEIVENKFFITNKKNTGGAYGILSNKKTILTTLSSISILSVILNFFINLKNKNTGKAVSMLLIFSGGLSNMLSRYEKKYVTDFLYIKGKNMPIFNIADIFVFIGCIISIFQSIIDTIANSLTKVHAHFKVNLL